MLLVNIPRYLGMYNQNVLNNHWETSRYLLVKKYYIYVGICYKLITLLALILIFNVNCILSNNNI